MRFQRLVLTLFTSAFLLVFLFILLPAVSDDGLQSHSESGFKSYFSFRTPLFPPSAIISLTDDNSTFFLARPAAFGPLLPSKGLSGQIWVGSGFAEHDLGRVGFEAGAEGELGCSDMAGWEGDYARAGHSPSSGPDRHAHKSKSYQKSAREDETSHRLRRAVAFHADIQSLQESAEITGKVVLLSRGGCGFLEKVKWAQRRGAMAVIVGDNVAGGPLVTMYAQGDTSNVSIPALFTSHTTAHLLSSLIPSKGFSTLRAHRTAHPAKDGASEHTAETVSVHGNGESSSVSSSAVLHSSRSGSGRNKISLKAWFASMLSAFDMTTKLSAVKTAQDDVRHVGGENLVIGVDDWRDADLVRARNSKPAAVEYSSNDNEQSQAKTKDRHILLEGGSVVPNSGEYRSEAVARPKHTKAWPAKSGTSRHSNNAKSSQEPPSSYHSRSGTRETQHQAPRIATAQTGSHEGLWVTLTPADMSATPFFDTLLVLVVSPLVTLTVVYALLLLRSRIRRRRWRAPKSIVERLPVRTYHTISSGSSSSTLSTPAVASPTTPLLSPATRRTISRNPSQARLRSHTTSEIPQPSSSASLGDGFEHVSNELEKREAGLAEWRRKYGGRQKECVVCLEEYVDGISRVMSLPCGHEFHAECITPWLTTRRRTCPICKGDVVRSLNAAQSRHTTSHFSTSQGSTARSPSILSSPAQSPYLSPAILHGRSLAGRQRTSFFGITSMDDDDNEEEVAQTQALLTRNDSPSSALPVPSLDRDVERGLSRSRSRSRRPPNLRHISSDDRHVSSSTTRDDADSTGLRNWISRNIFGGWSFVQDWSGMNTAPDQRQRGRRERQD